MAAKEEVEIRSEMLTIAHLLETIRARGRRISERLFLAYGHFRGEVLLDAWVIEWAYNNSRDRMVEELLDWYEARAMNEIYGAKPLFKTPYLRTMREKDDKKKAGHSEVY